MEKLIYRCKNCAWEKSIVAQWADVSPRYCGNPKCKCSGRLRREKSSFFKEPDMLEVVAPNKPEPHKEHEVVSKAQPVVESESEEKSSDRKHRRKKARGM